MAFNPEQFKASTQQYWDTLPTLAQQSMKFTGANPNAWKQSQKDVPEGWVVAPSGGQWQDGKYMLQSGSGATGEEAGVSQDNLKFDPKYGMLIKKDALPSLDKQHGRTWWGNLLEGVTVGGIALGMGAAGAEMLGAGAGVEGGAVAEGAATTGVPSAASSSFGAGAAPTFTSAPMISPELTTVMGQGAITPASLGVPTAAGGGIMTEAGGAAYSAALANGATAEEAMAAAQAAGGEVGTGSGMSVMDAYKTASNINRAKNILSPQQQQTAQRGSPTSGGSSDVNNTTQALNQLGMIFGTNSMWNELDKSSENLIGMLKGYLGGG